MLDLLKLLLSLCRPARILRWALLLLGMVVLWIFVERPHLEELFKARDRRNDYHDQVERLQQQQQRLQKDLADLKAGGFSLEKAVREQCPLLKPGEKIIFIEPPDSANTSRSAAAPLLPAGASKPSRPSGPASSGEAVTEAAAKPTPPPSPAAEGDEAKKPAKSDAKAKSSASRAKSSAKTAAGSAKAGKKGATRKTTRKSRED